MVGLSMFKKRELIKKELVKNPRISVYQIHKITGIPNSTISGQMERVLKEVHIRAIDLNCSSLEHLNYQKEILNNLLSIVNAQIGIVKKGDCP